MIDISKIRYPEMTNLLNLEPAPQIILGRELVVQEKRDGSNLGIYLGTNGELKIRSRNMDEASQDFYAALGRTTQAEGIHELLLDASQWGQEFVIFGEMLLKGKSPTRTELHDKEEFIIFDIWEATGQRWMSYVEVHQHCHHFGLPIVELYGTANIRKISTLIEFKDRMLEVALQKGREGVVIKAYKDHDGDIIFCKEKHDTPKFERVPRAEESGRPEYPELPESEIMGAIEKVLTDIGFGRFRDKKEAMPLCARYIGIECEKHFCRMPRTIYQYYERRLKDLA